MITRGIRNWPAAVNLLVVCLLATALIFAIGCQKQQSEAEKKAENTATTGGANPAPGLTGATATPQVRIDLKIDPPEPQPNKPATFTVSLRDVAGAPLDGAKVNAALVMKEMDMGKNEVPLADKGNGTYVGSGKFTMAGDWQVVVTAMMGTNKTEQKFDAKSVMPPPK